MTARAVQVLRLTDRQHYAQSEQNGDENTGHRVTRLRGTSPSGYYRGVSVDPVWQERLDPGNHGVIM
jgi:hypothetical protein